MDSKLILKQLNKNYLYICSPEEQVEEVNIQETGEAELQDHSISKRQRGESASKETKHCHVLWQ